MCPLKSMGRNRGWHVLDGSSQVHLPCYAAISQRKVAAEMENWDVLNMLSESCWGAGGGLDSVM